MPEKTDQQEWLRLQSEQGPALKIFNVRFDLMRNPRNGKTERMTILESPDAVNVVACNPQGHILFVKQYRFGIGRYTLELPGGMVDRGEPQEEAVRRELREETGAVSGHWTYLGKIPSNPVFQDSHIFHWLAEDIRIQQPPQLDDGEEIFMEWLPADIAETKLRTGQFEHPHTVNALLLYFNRAS